MKQAFLGLGSTSKLAVAGALLISANYAWATTAACTTKATLASFGVTAPTTGDGCYEADKTFSAFTVTNGSTGTGITQSTSTVDIQGSDTFSGVETLNSPYTVSEAFTAAAAGDFSVSGSNGDVTKGTMSMLVNSTNAFLTNPAYPTPQAGAHNLITTVSLSTLGSAGNSTGTADSLVVTEAFCFGSVACTVGATGDEVILTATYGNGSSTPSYTCALGAGVTAAHADIVAGSCPGTSSATPITVTFLSPVVSVTDVNVYTLVVHSTTTTTLTNYTDIFGEEELMPEPSTFILMGTALAGIAALRLRKRKQA